MLHSLGPGQVMLEGARFVPPILSPLITAAQRGEPLEPVVAALTHMFGFDSFMYATSLSPRRGQECISYVFTTLSREWVVRYNELAYIEADPRVLYSFDSAIPFVWDQLSERGKQTDCKQQSQACKAMLMPYAEKRRSRGAARNAP